MKYLYIDYPYHFVARIEEDGEMPSYILNRAALCIESDENPFIKDRFGLSTAPIYTIKELEKRWL